MDNLTIILVVLGMVLSIILTVAAFTIWKFFRQRFYQDKEPDIGNLKQRRRQNRRQKLWFKISALRFFTTFYWPQMDSSNEKEPISKTSCEEESITTKGTTEDITSTISSGNDSQLLDSSIQVNKSGEKDDDSDTESDDSDQLQTVNKDSSVSANDDLPTRTKRTYKKAGKIDFTTEYRKEEKTFEVHILHAYNLAPNRDINEVNPYVKVYLVPGKKQSQKTRWQKATKEPFINENFIFTELTNEDIDKHRLKLRVKNNKIKNEVLGEVEIPLSKKKKRRFKRDLCKKRSENTLALVHISLCHQAAYSKLEVIINEAKRLPKAGLKRNSDHYVTVMLFAKATTARKNTATKRNSRNPTFNEKLEFDIATDSTKLLSTYKLVVTVNNGGRFRDEVIGHVIFSLTSPQATAVQHWKSVEEQPHKYHSQWHYLVDPDEL